MRVVAGRRNGIKEQLEKTRERERNNKTTFYKERERDKEKSKRGNEKI